jgi:hypothetical protein
MAGKRYLVPIVLLLVALFMGLFQHQQTARADEFQAYTSFALSDYTPGANADIFISYSLAPVDVQYNLWFPTFMSPDFDVEVGRSMPVGADIGKLYSTSALGFSNTACNTILHPEFTFYNGTTNIWDVFDLDADRANGMDDDCKPGNNLPNHVDCYPTYLNKMFDPDETYISTGDVFDGIPPLVPRARYSSMVILPGDMYVILEFVMFDPGQLLQQGPPAAQNNPLGQYGPEWGYPSAVILEDPTIAEAPQSVTDFCTPLASLTNHLAVTLDNPDTTALDESGYVRQANPAAGTGLLLSGTHYDNASSSSYRELDGDGIENDFDTCPHIPNIDGDPKLTAGPDNDMIDSACDPSAYSAAAVCPGAPCENTADEDCDGVLDVNDNCTCVANPGSPQADADLDGVGDACDPDTASIGEPGYANPADIDNDGFLNAQDTCPLVKWPSEEEEERVDPFAADGGSRVDQIGTACDDDWDGDGQIIYYECTASWNSTNWGTACGTCTGTPPNHVCVANTGAGATEDDWVFHRHARDGAYYGSTGIAPLCIGGVDADGSGLCAGIDPDDTWKRDNCPQTANGPGPQADADGDGIGDACDDGKNYVPALSEDAAGEGTCGDGIDNDSDGPDMWDGDGDCRASKYYDPTKSEDAAGPDTCGDGDDNGPDGNADMQDLDCWTDFVAGADADQDQDGVSNAHQEDNCPTAYNPPSDCDNLPGTPDEQCDSEGDGIGDACDPSAFLAEAYLTDIDADTVADILDNCTHVANADQADTDGDKTGDACDPAGGSSSRLDMDADTLQNTGPGKIMPDIEVYWMRWTASLMEGGAASGIYYPCNDGVDNDNDGLVDGADPGCTCPVADSDCDGICDPGLTDPKCVRKNLEKQTPPPSPPNPVSGYWHEIWPTPSQVWHLTSWEDTEVMDILDPSDQIDMTDESGNVYWFHVDLVTGPPDEPDYMEATLKDNCPDQPNPNQTDTDNDGVGDACDDDSDGDGISDADEAENCPGSYDTDWCDAFDINLPATADPDNDGVDTTTELADGTNPCNADTDGDSEGLRRTDGRPFWRDGIEKFVGTNPLDNCPNTSTSNDEPVDAWPPDFNDSQKVTSGDLQIFALHYNDAATYGARYDLNASGGPKITAGDLQIFAIYYTDGKPNGNDQCVP